VSRAPQRSVLRYDDGGWTEAVGGQVALDLVNTVSWRPDPDRAVERLPDGRALVAWARFVGVLDDERAEAFLQDVADDPAVGDRAAAGVRRARELAYRVLSPLAQQEQPAAADVVALHRWLLGVLGRAEVSAVMPLAWSTGLVSVDGLADELGLHVWRLLEREDSRRIRQCRDDACGWLFLDRTKNASRVWCSSGDCGNRARARRHYAAHRASS
jgi:predicted RNA-binding Zn ribbon-like protein